MRTGGSILRHGLTVAAAAVVGQAVALARRRGHAQVTPLHVASTMLTSGGSFRVACLLSHHSHPLRCNALDLCLNVALNRLPAAYSSHHRPLPSLSNSLVAAFKRAQAHHRRGVATDTSSSSSSTPPPPPLLPVKIELDHLAVSILDDPSVSRVMREAGFCSAQVKLNLEQSSIESRPNPPPKSNLSDEIRVMEALTSKQRKNLVLVGESLDAIDAVARAVIHRVQATGNNDVPEPLKNAQIITLPPLVSFKNTPRSNFDEKIADLRRNIFRDSTHGTMLVLYLGDLQSIAENRAINGDAVEQLIMEIRSFISNRVCLMAIATYKAYMSCKVEFPSLEARLRLQPLTIPAISFELSLNFNCVSDFSCEAEALPSSSWHQHYRFGSSSPCDEDSLSSISSFDQLPLSLGLNQRHWQLPTVSAFDKSSNPNSCTSSSTMEVEYIPKFRELNAENLKILCDALEKDFPSRQETVTEIATAVLQSRSGMIKRKWKSSTWLFFEGEDTESKRRIARELASLVFGSQSNLISISLDKSRLFDVGYDHYPCKKRSRIEPSDSCLERLFQALNEDPHRVILIEDINQLDHQTRVGFKNAMEGGKVRSYNGAEASLSDAIIILTNCSSTKPNTWEINEREKEVNVHLSLDLNLSTTVCDDDVKDNGSFDAVGLLELADGMFFFEFLHQDP
ncbi:protein SMAX1-LIKE 3-like [Zingiber officinale]|uniref:Clp R domain-containing protein n=1 Tax=Zingiber officinale TaxID=94328 RepID=A0A8J5EYW4_ZINOF|nr:protein SMAX1-LIKE 3-like [Zingiber officinale]KAG6477430.1 hypothetical protein ZIOFF_066685 [Zingiber officinale]